MMLFSKVKAGGLAGLIVTAIIALLGQFGVDVSPSLAALITAIVSALLAYLKVERVGYNTAMPKVEMRDGKVKRGL